MTTPRLRRAAHYAALLLILAYLIVRAEQVLYNRRVIGYRVAGRMLCAARILRQRAERRNARND
jgi:hypothetical protein